jgi:thymidylate synthase (FAD)
MKGLKRVIERGHTSVLEHATFTLSIEGISRACSHQLVRHRMASYSQQSQRRVKLKGGDYIVPPSVAANAKAEEFYRDLMDAAWRGYAKLIEMGIPTEDARFVLPNSAKTNLVVTMNARSLLNFFELRCCLHAQWEIRELAYEMLRRAKKVAPLIFGSAGPPCEVRGICPEKDTSCSFYRKFIAGKNGGADQS